MEQPAVEQPSQSPVAQEATAYTDAYTDEMQQGYAFQNGASLLQPAQPMQFGLQMPQLGFQPVLGDGVLGAGSFSQPSNLTQQYPFVFYPAFEEEPTSSDGEPGRAVSAEASQPVSHGSAGSEVVQKKTRDVTLGKKKKKSAGCMCF